MYVMDYILLDQVTFSSHNLLLKKKKNPSVQSLREAKLNIERKKERKKERKERAERRIDHKVETFFEGE